LTVRRAAALLFVVTAAACGASQPRILTFAGQLPEAVVPLAWLEGRWERPGAQLTFAAAGPAIFGVAFEAGAAETWIIDAPVRRAQLEIDGATLVVGGHGRNFASFSGVARRVRLERKGEMLIVTTNRGVARYRRAGSLEAPELDQADLLWTGPNPLAEMERHVVAAAPSPTGELGFTIGFYRSRDGVHRGAYVAIWEKTTTGWSLRRTATR
jgi:hypothetical protein